MKLTVVLAVLIGILVLACSTAAPLPVEPTPNIDATVEAKVEAALAKVPTVTPIPTATPAPTPTLIPTATPPPTLTPTPTVTPAQTSVYIDVHETIAEFGFQGGVRKIAESYSYPLYEVIEEMKPNFPVEFRESIQQLVTDAGFPQGQVTCDMYDNSLDSSSREKLEQISFSFGFEDTSTEISITPDEILVAPCYAAVATATSVPTPTPRPIPTATPLPTSKPVSRSCEGKTIRFKIGTVWANESIVWAQGGGDELNLTASTTSLPSKHITSWPISAPAQRVPPHVLVGSVNAVDGTSISAWYEGTQMATTTASGGSYSIIVDQGEGCVSTTATSVPTPTAAPTATPEPGYALHINGSQVRSGQFSIAIPNGTVDLLQIADADSTYGKGSYVNLSVTPNNSQSTISFLGGFFTTTGTTATIVMDNEMWVTITITPPVLPSPTSTPSPSPSTSQGGGDCSYSLVIDQGDSGFSGLVIRFKIGDMWASETLVWQQGGGDELNLTVSSARIPYYSIVEWPISSISPAVITMVLPQSAPPHVVVGSANASSGTTITAWIDGVEVASTNCS